MRLIDRYLLREVLPPTALGLLVFTFILEIPPIMDQAEKLAAKGVAWGTIGQILLTLLPQALGLTIPMSLLIGLLIGLGRLSGDRETVALQACGVSVFRMLWPVSGLAALAWAATSYVLIEALPDANQRYREITYNIVAARAENEIKPRVFFEDFPSLVLYVRDVPAEGGGWRDVFLADTRKPNQPDIFVAARGRMVLDRARRRVDMLLEHGTRHRVAGQSAEKYEVTRFDQLTLGLDPETVFPLAGPQRGYRELTIAELQAEASQLRQRGESPHRPIMEIQKKFSIPVACLVFAFIGLALGVTSRRDSKLASFVLGTAVIFLYYVIMYMGESLAKGGLVPAHLAMWLPNIALGAAGIFLLVWRSHSVERRLTIPLPFGWRQTEAQHLATIPPGTRAQGKRVVVVIRVPQFWLPRPNILDGYVTRVYSRIFALAFVGMLGIFYIATFIDLSDKLFKGQTTGWMLAQYFYYATPQFIYYVMPIAALVATLVTIGLLTKSSELVVMRACGISLYRTALPLLLCGTTWSMALFALEESILAHANRRAEAIRHVIRGGSPRTFDVLNRKWILGHGGDIYHYAYYDPRLRELNGLSIYEFADNAWRLERRTYATRAAYRGTWAGRQVWMREFTGSADPTTYRTYGTHDLSLEPPDYFVTEQPDAERMTYRQLEQYVLELRASGFNVIPYAVALYRKVAFPFVTVIMTLIAVPFAVTTGRRGALYGIGIGIVLAIGYWMVISVFAAIGSAGLIAPLLAAWAPNVMFGAGAAYLLLTVRT